MFIPRRGHYLEDVRIYIRLVIYKQFGIHTSLWECNFTTQSTDNLC